MASVDVMTRTPFEIAPTERQRGSVIWLHGLGASNRDFEPIVPELRAPFLRFVFPSAPPRRVTINSGLRMRAWYDIIALGAPAPQEDEAHLRESAAALTALVEREHERGVAYENIVLAGFSQGGSMVLHTGLRSKQRLAGILVVSAYLPAAHLLAAEAEPARRDTPILFCHGRSDPVVPLVGGQMSHAFVTASGFSAEWAEFDVEHTMSLEEVHFIARWLAARFPEG
jgi:phospholipase/carboxylesterase